MLIEKDIGKQIMINRLRELANKIESGEYNNPSMSESVILVDGVSSNPFKIAEFDNGIREIYLKYIIKDFGIKEL